MADVNASCHAFQRKLLLPKDTRHRKPWMIEPWPLRQSHTPTPRVFDAFLFAGELELLETRLHVLSAVVDVFVIVEADAAHSGGYNRTLAFPAARHRFEPFMQRIRYRARMAR